MASKRELVLRAVEAALNGAGKPQGLTVFRHRTAPLDFFELPALVIFLGAEQPSLISHDPLLVERRLLLRIEARAIGEPADAVLDAALSWVVRALLSDPALSELVQSISEQKTVWDSEPSEEALAAAAIEFMIVYETLEGDPEQDG